MFATLRQKKWFLASVFLVGMAMLLAIPHWFTTMSYPEIRCIGGNCFFQGLAGVLLIVGFGVWSSVPRRKRFVTLARILLFILCLLLTVMSGVFVSLAKYHDRRAKVLASPNLNWDQVPKAPRWVDLPIRVFSHLVFVLGMFPLFRWQMSIIPPMPPEPRPPGMQSREIRDKWWVKYH